MPRGHQRRPDEDDYDDQVYDVDVDADDDGASAPRGWLAQPPPPREPSAGHAAADEPEKPWIRLADTLQRTWTAVAPRPRKGSLSPLVASGLFYWARPEHFLVLLLFVPVALAAGARAWSARLVFALNALALTGLEIFTSSSLERASLAVEGSAPVVAALCAEAIPAVFPTTIGLVSVLAGEIDLARTFIIGSVLNNILLGMGAALFAGGVRTHYSQDISETAFELVKLTLISTAPLIMAWAMIFVMNKASDDPDTAVTWLSRGTALALLLVYAMWVLFRRGTHRAQFAAADRRAADIFLRSRRDDARRVSGPRQALLWLAAAAGLAASVFCARFLIASVDALNGDGALYRHFIASILLPMAVNFYNYLRSAEIARYERDVSLSVHLTYGAGVSNVLLTLPLMVLVGWASGHDLLFEFDPFDVAILAAGVWASSILMTGQSDYFRGVLYLGLYLIIALSIFLYKK